MNHQKKPETLEEAQSNLATALGLIDGVSGFLYAKHHEETKYSRRAVNSLKIAIEKLSKDLDFELGRPSNPSSRARI